MNVGRRLYEEIERVVEFYRDGGEQRIAEINQEGLTLKAQVVDIDRVGCVLQSLQVIYPAPYINVNVAEKAEAAKEALKRFGCEFHLVEVDHADHRALLRSLPEASGKEGCQYFEALIEGEPNFSVSVHRYFYSYNPQAKRRALCDFALTIETLEWITQALAGLAHD